jgi:ketosteroid isomerase-like protein
VSLENLEAYRRVAAAWNNGDLDAWLDSFPQDWQFISSGAFPGLQEIYSGREGARSLWRDMRGPWQEFKISIERIEDLGDAVLALITFEVIGRDGIRASQRWAHLVTFENGLTLKIENYTTWEQALKAAGLEK